MNRYCPSDPSQTGKKGKSSPYGTLNSKTISSNNDDQNDNNEYIKITDEEIDVNNNSSNLNELSDPYDILVDLNDKTSKLIIRLIQYNGNELQPIIKLGMNENKNSPQRQKIDDISLFLFSGLFKRFLMKMSSKPKDIKAPNKDTKLIA